MYDETIFSWDGIKPEYHARKGENMAKKNYYAVKQGKVPGIYRTWDACKAQVHGYPGRNLQGI